MRILHVSTARTFGGCERHFADLTAGLAERGHEVFAAVRPSCRWKNRLSALPDENHFEVSIRNSFGVLSALKIADLVREKQIEIVHAHVARDYIPANIASIASNSKFVLTRHIPPPLKPFNRLALKNLSRAIAISEPIASGLKDLFPPSKVVVISNGIRMENGGPDDKQKLKEEFRSFHNIPSTAPLVGTMGDLKERKGQREFVLAAAEVLKSSPECRFVIAGEDRTVKKEYRRDLKRLVKTFGAEESFIWLDSPEDTRPFFAAIDLFVSPSRSENYGFAILEAMASRTAIIATETDPAKHLLGINGALISIDDPVALSRRIAEVIDDGNSREQMAMEAGNRAAEIFDLDAMIDKTERVYKEVIAQK